MQMTTERFGKIFRAAIFVVTVSAIQASAATFTVTNTNNSGAGSLRQAVADSNAAAGSDTIVFDAAVFGTPQTIQLASTITINVNPRTETTTITGPGIDLLTIRGNGAADGSGRIFTKAQVFNEVSTLSISAMTLTNAGFSALNNPAANLNVTNVAFVSNSNSFSGGAINNSATLTVTACTFTNNMTTDGGATGNGGGAIFNLGAGATATIADSTFTGNRQTAGGSSGGAIRNRQGTVTITNSTFSNNTSLNGGGAISNGDTLSVSGSTFVGNSTTAATANGGGISSTSAGQLTVSNSVVNGNSTAGSGGGIYHQPNAATGARGSYRFRDLPVGAVYVLQIKAKRFTFANSVQVVSLTEDTGEFNFVANY